MPENTPKFVEMFKEKNPTIQINEEGIILGPHERVNIPSGIKINVPEGCALIAYNKSGVSLKYGLDVGATVVDEDYTGIIHISLVNTSEDIVKINYGQKIVQWLLIPVRYDMLEEVNSEEDCFDRESERGDGAFGSTGNY